MDKETFWLIDQDDYYPQLALTDWHGPFETLEALSQYAVDRGDQWQFVVRIRQNIPEIIWRRNYPEWARDDIDFVKWNGTRIPTAHRT